MARRQTVGGAEGASLHKVVEPGARPGTLVAHPDASPPTRIRVVAFGPDGVDELDIHDPRGAGALHGRRAVTWFDVDGVGDVRLVEALGRELDLHPLALEDAVSLYQRPKLEEYPSNLFIVLRMPKHAGCVRTEQLAMFVGDGYVVTFQGGEPGDCLDPVRRRLRVAGSRHRNSGADYLAYSLIDAVVDQHFPVLEQVGEAIEELEDALVAGPVADAPSKIRAAKQELQLLRRSIAPLREVLASLAREETAFVRPDTQIFLRDCLDHAGQLADAIGSYREIVAGMMDLHLSSVSNRMNEVMKFLTLVSAIFIPLTFVVGVYGMNFDPHASPWNMPELEWRYGYPAVLLVMLTLAAGTLLWFRRKGWLGPTR